MIHGKKARPIQKDGTLQRVLVGGLGPAPTVGHPWVGPPGASTCNEHAAFSSGCGPYLVRMIHGKKARPIQKDGTLQRVLVGGLGPAPTVGHPWVGPPGASTCNEHAAFSSGCGPYLVRMIHGKKARPIQKDGTLQRVLVGGLGPAPTVGHPWVGPPGASTCNEHAAFSSGCGPCVTRGSARQAYLVRMIHGKKARPIQKDGTLQRVLVGGLGPSTNRGSPVGRPARRFHMQ
jgi:hypothetical protein